MYRKQIEDWDQDEFLADNNYAEQEEYRSLDFDFKTEREYEKELVAQLEERLDAMEEEEKERLESEEGEDEALKDMGSEEELDAFVVQLFEEAARG